LSPTAFEPLGFSPRETVVCAVGYVLHTYIGVSSLAGRMPNWTHRCNRNIPYCTYNCLPEGEPRSFETCRRQQRL